MGTGARIGVWGQVLGARKNDASKDRAESPAACRTPKISLLIFCNDLLIFLKRQNKLFYFCQKLTDDEKRQQL